MKKDIDIDFDCLSPALKLHIRQTIESEKIVIGNEKEFKIFYRELLDNIGEQLSYYIKWGCKE